MGQLRSSKRDEFADAHTDYAMAFIEFCMHYDEHGQLLEPRIWHYSRNGLLGIQHQLMLLQRPFHSYITTKDVFRRR
eukprot:scaffold6638_cov127-Cylindrotheca_fusiformis.AAC.14